jgi:hypothetical protein
VLFCNRDGGNIRIAEESPRLKEYESERLIVAGNEQGASGPFEQIPAPLG